MIIQGMFLDWIIFNYAKECESRILIYPKIKEKLYILASYIYP